ncbi:hypothetical protein NDU88_000419 [Pleurodeles waltl]|uniref:Uncharacterized protein n=1 Tax=Pleurodeles waltl TaxID=8319 RepID=A0AAV7N9G1_PLEWA|nr:hypothetical protein NDU88_000419 [Pleurodeles waltl]
MANAGPMLAACMRDMEEKMAAEECKMRERAETAPALTVVLFQSRAPRPAAAGEEVVIPGLADSHFRFRVSDGRDSRSSRCTRVPVSAPVFSCCGGGRKEPCSVYLHFLTFGDITSSPGCLSAPLLPEGQLELGHVCRLPPRSFVIACTLVLVRPCVWDNLDPPYNTHKGTTECRFINTQNDEY